MNAFADDARRVVVVVDQFEELFTIGRDASVRDRFMDQLVAAATDSTNTAVLVLLRADYYGMCGMHAGFARLLERSQVLVGAMSASELREVIVEPAARAGLRVDDDLVDVICRDAGSEPGALPLVSTALMETWARRADDTLTVAAYDNAGGVQGALASLADRAYASLEPPQQEVARRILLRLAAVGEGNDDVRRRADRREIDTIDGAPEVLAVLTDHRLITVDRESVEVAHEALLREWPRLREWLEEDREGRRLQHHIAQDANDWIAAGHDADRLYRGTRLAAAEEWVDAHPTDARTLELEFIDAGRAQREAEHVRAGRRARQLRILAAGLASLLVVSVVVGGLALVQRNRAKHSTLVADAGRIAAQARNMGADQLDLALLLAVQSRRLVESNATDGGLEAVLARMPPGFEYSQRIPQTYTGVAASPDGRRLAVAGADGVVTLADGGDWRSLHRLHGFPAGSFDYGAGVAFSGDGAKVAGGGNGTVIVWSADTGARVGRPLPVGSGLATVKFDPTDSTRLFTAAQDTARQWDLRDPDHPKRIAAYKFPQQGDNGYPLLSLSPNGRLLAVGSTTKHVTDVWDTRSGREVLTSVPGDAGGFTPDGSRLVLARGDRIVLVDPSTGATHGPALTGFRAANPALVVSPDGRYLAASDLVDNTMRVFDLTTGRQRGPFLRGLQRPLLPGRVPRRRPSRRRRHRSPDLVAVLGADVAARDAAAHALRGPRPGRAHLPVVDARRLPDHHGRPRGPGRASLAGVGRSRSRKVPRRSSRAPGPRRLQPRRQDRRHRPARRNRRPVRRRDRRADIGARCPPGASSATLDRLESSRRSDRDRVVRLFDRLVGRLRPASPPRPRAHTNRPGAPIVLWCHCMVQSGWAAHRGGRLRRRRSRLRRRKRPPPLDVPGSEPVPRRTGVQSRQCDRHDGRREHAEARSTSLRGGPSERSNGFRRTRASSSQPAASGSQWH